MANTALGAAAAYDQPECLDLLLFGVPPPPPPPSAAVAFAAYGASGDDADVDEVEQDDDANNRGIDKSVGTNSDVRSHKISGGGSVAYMAAVYSPAFLSYHWHLAQYPGSVNKRVDSGETFSNANADSGFLWTTPTAAFFGRTGGYKLPTRPRPPASRNS